MFYNPWRLVSQDLLFRKISNYYVFRVTTSWWIIIIGIDDILNAPSGGWSFLKIRFWWDFLISPVTSSWLVNSCSSNYKLSYSSLASLFIIHCVLSSTSCIFRNIAMSHCFLIRKKYFVLISFSMSVLQNVPFPSLPLLADGGILDIVLPWLV